MNGIVHGVCHVKKRGPVIFLQSMMRNSENGEENIDGDNFKETHDTWYFIKKRTSHNVFADIIGEW